MSGEKNIRPIVPSLNLIHSSISAIQVREEFKACR